VGTILATLKADKDVGSVNEYLEHLITWDSKLGFDKPHERPVLGIDFGMTICGLKVEDGETVKSKDDADFFKRPFLGGAIQIIKELVSLFGPRSVYIISKCALESERLIKEWLRRNNFWQLTGMREENIRFCRQRHEKADHCRELGVTHFVDVDDRREVLSHLSEVGVRIALNPRDDDPDEAPFLKQSLRDDPFTKYLQRPVVVAKTWEEAQEVILQSFNPVKPLCTM
jgi:hypothetical protein